MDPRDDSTVCLGRGICFSVGRDHPMGQDVIGGKVEFVHEIYALMGCGVDLGFAEFSFMGVAPKGNAIRMGIQTSVVFPVGFACVPSLFRVVDELGSTAVSGYEIMV